MVHLLGKATVRGAMDESSGKRTVRARDEIRLKPGKKNKITEAESELQNGAQGLFSMGCYYVLYDN